MALKVEDLDGVPMTSSPPSSSSSRRDRVKREIKTEVSTPVLATSKWDNLDPEPDIDESSRKRSKSKAKDVEDIFFDIDNSARSRKRLSSDEDLDGTALETSPEAATPHSSDSRFVQIVLGTN